MKQNIMMLLVLSIAYVIVGCNGSGSGSTENRITSEPKTITTVGSFYEYRIVTNFDANISILEKPLWLVHDNNILYGTPLNVGVENVVIRASGNDGYIFQDYTLNVVDDFIGFDSNLVFFPSFNIGYKATVIPVEFILTPIDDISEYSVVFIRSIGGSELDYVFGSVYKDITHNGIVSVRASLLIPENESLNSVEHLISIMYIRGSEKKFIHAINLSQKNFIPETVVHEVVVDMKNANGGYELYTDSNGIVHVVPNVSFMKDFCEVQDWLWNQTALVCVPKPDTPEYDDVLACINNDESPNKWDFNIHICYAEITPDISVEDACNIIGGDFNSTNGVCSN